MIYLSNMNTDNPKSKSLILAFEKMTVKQLEKMKKTNPLLSQEFKKEIDRIITRRKP